jgi:hypothetical protein
MKVELLFFGIRTLVIDLGGVPLVERKDLIEN